MANVRKCINCNKEFIPKQDWMVICPECFKNKKKNEYNKKVEKNKEEMKMLPPDPLNTITLDFGIYNGCNLFQIFYTDKDYFEYLVKSALNPKFINRNKELIEELNTFRQRLYKYIVMKCFKILRKSLSSNEAVYSKGIHAVGIEYGIKGQFFIQQIMSHKPILYLVNKDCYCIGIRLEGETFLHLLAKLNKLTNGGHSEYSCYTLF